jgi:glycerate dehydrogenase
MIIKALDRASVGMDTPLEILNSIGEVTVYDASSPDEVLERVSDAEVVIINKVKITREVIDSAPSLKIVCVFATGFDNIDIKYAKEKGIAVCNVPGYSTDSVALFTVATVLNLFTHINEYREFVTSGEYTASGSPNRLIPVYHELKGKKWGIVGYGNIGKAVAKIASALGCEILANKRTPTDEVRCVDIDTLCRECDIITLHCPLNDSTRGLISRERLALMKRDAVLVNEARGAVLDEGAVAEALLNGKIGGFGCDVYSVEPFGKDHPYNKIMKLDNCYLTPHAAWGSYEARERCISIIADNIKAFYDGKIKNRVDI